MPIKSNPSGTSNTNESIFTKIEMYVYNGKPVQSKNLKYDSYSYSSMFIAVNNLGLFA